MLRHMDIAVRAITPIWTGGAEAGHMDRVRETGMLLEASDGGTKPSFRGVVCTPATRPGRAASMRGCPDFAFPHQLQYDDLARNEQRPDSLLIK